MSACQRCGAPLPVRTGPGRPRKYCSDSCRHGTTPPGEREAYTECQGCGTPLPASKSRSRPRKWCSNRCRKRTLYTGTCVDCGGRTGYNGTTTPSERCLTCSIRRNTYWTQERIIEAIREWSDENGEPPTATQWNPAQARQQGLNWMADRYQSGAWPATSHVQHRFGSWNAGIRAAGFTPRKPGVHGPWWYRPEAKAA